MMIATAMMLEMEIRSACQVLLVRMTHRMMSNNSFSDYDDDYNVHGKAIDCNNDDGNGNDDDTFYGTIEVKIPEDELNYRASNFNKIL